MAEGFDEQSHGDLKHGPQGGNGRRQPRQAGEHVGAEGARALSERHGNVQAHNLAAETEAALHGAKHHGLGVGEQ